jgi:hypothetical protein
VAAFVPWQAAVGAAHEQQSSRPEDGDQHCTRGEAPRDQCGRQLGGHHHNHQQRHHQSALQHEGQGGRQESQGLTGPHACGIQGHQYDGLNRDAAENVSDSDIKLVGECGAGCDRDLRQVRGDGEHDDPTQRRP